MWKTSPGTAYLVALDVLGLQELVAMLALLAGVNDCFRLEFIREVRQMVERPALGLTRFKAASMSCSSRYLKDSVVPQSW